MEPLKAFESACAYTSDSINRCHELSLFIKKRLAIEEDYSKQLKKLCKSVSLTPLQQTKGGSWPWSKKMDSSNTVQEVFKTSLWNTFYEIIDETSQIAKSHTALAESLQHQLLEPLTASLQEMEFVRKQIVEQGNSLAKGIEEASTSLKKARKNFDQSNKEAVSRKNLIEKFENNQFKTKDLEKAKQNLIKAEEKFAHSRQIFRQQEESLKNMNSKLYSQELPKLMTKLQQQEVQRSREALSYILGLIELERRCAVMNENYANEMALKLKQINLVEDERQFTQTFISLNPSMPNGGVIQNRSLQRPISPLPNLPISHDIPRTLSMPPSYESQNADRDMNVIPFHHNTGSATMLVNGGYYPEATHVRHLTADDPSYP